MINQNLERRYADCRELIDQWQAFRDIINRVREEPEVIDQDLEEEFLGIKARIAMLHDSFMDSLKTDRKVGTGVIDIVNRVITLRLHLKTSPVELEKMKTEWHEAFMLLKETVTNMEDERERLANTNEYVHKSKVMVDRMATNTRSYLTSIYFKVAVGIGIFVLVVWGVPAFGIYDWTDLRDDAPFTSPVIHQYSKFAREVLGLPVAYFEMADFTSKLLNETPPGISEQNRVDVEADISSSDAKSQLLPRLQLWADPSDRERFEELWDRAEGYAAIRYIGSEGSRPSGNLFLLWFRRTEDADNFIIRRNRHAAQMGGDLAVEQYINVIAIIRAGDSGFRETIRTAALGQMNS